MSFEKEYKELLSPMLIGTMNEGRDSESLDPKFGWETIYETVGYSEETSNPNLNSDTDRVEIVKRFFFPLKDNDGEEMILQPGERSEALKIVEKESFDSEKENVAMYKILSADLVLNHHFEVVATAHEY